MTILHIDLLYLSARTYFHTDILMKNKQSILLRTLKPVDSISSKEQSGFYYIEASFNKQRYAVTILIEGNEEKSMLISQIQPDTGKVFFLCKVTIQYNLIRFERGFFMSDYVENKWVWRCDVGTPVKYRKTPAICELEICTLTISKGKHKEASSFFQQPRYGF